MGPSLGFATVNGMTIGYTGRRGEYSSDGGHTRSGGSRQTQLNRAHCMQSKSLHIHGWSGEHVTKCDESRKYRGSWRRMAVAELVVVARLIFFSLVCFKQIKFRPQASRFYCNNIA